MRKREIAVLACKLFSLYILYRALLAVGAVTSFTLWPSRQQEGWFTFIVSSLPLLLLIGFGLLLWVKAGWIATHLILVRRADTGNATPDLGDIQALAFSVLGAFVLTESLPRLTEAVISLLYSTQNRSWVDFWAILGDPSWVAWLVSLVVQLILGVVLCFGARGFVGLVRTVRTAGLPRTPENAG